MRINKSVSWKRWFFFFKNKIKSDKNLSFLLTFWDGENIKQNTYGKQVCYRKTSIWQMGHKLSYVINGFKVYRSEMILFKELWYDSTNKSQTSERMSDSIQILQWNFLNQIKTYDKNTWGREWIDSSVAKQTFGSKQARIFLKKNLNNNGHLTSYQCKG